MPVDATTFTMDKQQYTIETPAPKPSSTGDEDENRRSSPATRTTTACSSSTTTCAPRSGTRARRSSPSTPAARPQLPLLRLMEKAYAETHGYPYAEMGEGRFWDELTSAPDAAEDQQSFKVYLPIQQCSKRVTASIAKTDGFGRPFFGFRSSARVRDGQRCSAQSRFSASFPRLRRSARVPRRTACAHSAAPLRTRRRPRASAPRARAANRC